MRFQRRTRSAEGRHNIEGGVMAKLKCPKCGSEGIIKQGIDVHGREVMMNKNCELCNGSGWYGDNGPGRRGNREYVPCEECNPNIIESIRSKNKERRVSHECQRDYL